LYETWLQHIGCKGGVLLETDTLNIQQNPPQTPSHPPSHPPRNPPRHPATSATHLLHSLTIPSGAAIRHRNRMLLSATPLDSRTSTAVVALLPLLRIGSISST